MGGLSTGLCRYDAYETVAAQLTGPDYPASGEVCDDPAVHTAVIRRVGDGLTVEVAVEVCETHDLVLSSAPGWETSRRIHRAKELYA